MIKSVNETLKHPRMLLGFMLVPQLLLLLLNGRAWRIVRGEMNPEQLQLALRICSYEVVLLLAAAAAWLVLHRRKRHVDLRLCGVILLAGIGYLWLFTAYSTRVIPATVADWMLPGSQILYYQYALMMPALFYAGLRLACFPIRIPKAADLSLSLLALIAVPVGWYVFVRLINALWRYVDPAVYAVLALAVGSTVILLIAFLRVLTYAYVWLASVGWGRPVMLFVAGLMAPIGGLLLNRKIPFPYDFQSQSVYILTCLNALVLLLPFPGKTGRQTLVWSLRCMTYPFTMYFFIVFLPFLPLALPAMIAAGAGFLILAPTLLFVVHTRTLVEEGCMLGARFGRLRVLALFGVCVALIPLGLTGRAGMDQHALAQALDAAYRPDYASGQASVSRAALQRTLRRLHDIKHGIYLPFITDGYDAIVLDGMILPDRKIEHLETMFFGHARKCDKPAGMFREIFNPAAQRRDMRNRNRVVLPQRDVQLMRVEPDTRVSEDTTTTTLVLTLENNGGDGSEFVTDITVPAGVFISGYWLHIGGDRVHGRIFEKKAAMWVYHMIRDQTRRDPGMLVYTGHDTVRLNVFPLAAGETRLTEIAFSYPTGTSPRLRIGELAVDLHPGVDDAGHVFQNQGIDSIDLIIPAATAAAMPLVTRKPYLHFIVDCSEQAASAYAGFTQILERVHAQIADVDMCQVTLANYEFVHVSPGMIPLANAPRVITGHQGTLPFRGALCPERAIRSALLSVRDHPVLDADNIPLAPVFVIVKAAGSRLLREEDDFGPFADMTPDVDAYYVTRPDGRLDAHAFRGSRPVDVVSTLPPPAPVTLLRAGGAYAVCAADRASVVRLPAGEPLEYYNAAEGRYVPLARIKPLPADSLPAQGLALMRAWEQTRYHPATADAKRRELLGLSRASGILMPATAYIVVENSAQWNMLERAEAKSLKADGKLEFDEFIESPAPPLLILLPIVFLLPIMRRRSRRQPDTG